MAFPTLRFPDQLPQTGTGTQMRKILLSVWNSLLPKPTQEALQRYRLANENNITGITPDMATLMFCPTKNSLYEQIVSNKKYIDVISNTPIPRLDCHVWYEIDGQIDDYTPIEIHMGFFTILCTEYEPYADDIQKKMRSRSARSVR